MKALGNWRTFTRAAILGGLLFLLLQMPQVAMQGARNGLSVWADAVLPALLPFFVITSLMLESGVFSLIPRFITAPICWLFRLSPQAASTLLAAWLSGAPNSARLCAGLYERGDITRGEAARFLSAGTLTGPLFLIGTVGLYLGNPRLGLMIYLVQWCTALCNGVLWRACGEPPQKAQFHTPEKASLLTLLPQIMKSSCLSVLFVGGTIAVFSALHAVLEQTNIAESIGAMLQFAIPTDAVAPVLSAMLEISTGALEIAHCGLSLPVRVSLLCAVSAFSGFSVVCQSATFLASLTRIHIFLAQRLTHALLAFLACRMTFFFFGASVPAFATLQPALIPVDLHPVALPVLALCLLFGFIPWTRTH